MSEEIKAVISQTESKINDTVNPTTVEESEVAPTTVEESTVVPETETPVEAEAETEPVVEESTTATKTEEPKLKVEWLSLFLRQDILYNIYYCYCCYCCSSLTMINVYIRRSSNRLLSLSSSFTFTRSLSSTTSNLALQGSQSFAKKNQSYDNSKNRKGSGNDLNFSKSILTKNYKKKANNLSIIQDLPILNNKNLKLNSIVKYDEEILKKLYILGSFKPNQFNELFNKPITLLRNKESHEIFKFYENTLIKESKFNKLIITGEKGVGKSTILTQFHSHALSSDGIILPITNMQSLLDGSNDFKFNNELKTYDQQMYSKKLLKKIYNLNKDLLIQLPLLNDFIPIYDSNKLKLSSSLKIGSNITLCDLIKLSLSKPINSTHVLTFLINELSKQEKFPTYLSIDNFNALTQYNYTKYKDIDDKFIKYNKFTIVNTLLDLISGQISFNKGGIILSTSSNFKINDTLKVGLNLIEPNYYAKNSEFDLELSQLLLNSNLENLKIDRFSITEVGKLVKFLNDCDLIFNDFNKIDELNSVNGDKDEYLKNLINKKYLISGGGNVKDVIKSCVLGYV
ncbi:hypothetical protein CANARDRAFT_19677 [[Candida] arabinofermentans NRRL YB-2248]|uniref:Small ribosomal subunit protein mS29 n=1 Tax=[Candida] arabinofermentans NRRL YB-2248 TaxID=983967 RepID=A0A1E4SUW6_9ASCO|nr:hypothetical protein CANARDRAFT_19677 [[Candida] arabinofermentans NRRL YB-2248]